MWEIATQTFEVPVGFLKKILLKSAWVSLSVVEDYKHIERPLTSKMLEHVEQVGYEISCLLGDSVDNLEHALCSYD